MYEIKAIMLQNTEKHTIMENTLSDVLFEPSEKDYEFVDAIVDAMYSPHWLDAAHFENLDEWRRANGKPTFAEYHGGFGVEWFYHPIE